MRKICLIYNKKIKQNYDTEIAFLEGPITRLFSTKNKDVHKIAWIHNDIEKVFGNDLKSKIKKYIDKKIYKKYNDLVFHQFLYGLSHEPLLYVSFSKAFH